MDFFTFWVSEVWGNSTLSLFGTALIYTIIGVLGKMSYVLLFTLLALYFVIFGIGFYGVIFWLPVFLFSMVYFFTQMYEFIQNRA